MGHFMLRYFPGKSELIVLSTMAALCTVVISLVHSRDTGLFLLAFPLFLSSAMLGLWKSGRLRPDAPKAEG
jgi:hypothetical protein